MAYLHRMDLRYNAKSIAGGYFSVYLFICLFFFFFNVLLPGHCSASDRLRLLCLGNHFSLDFELKPSLAKLHTPISRIRVGTPGALYHR